MKRAFGITVGIGTGIVTLVGGLLLTWFLVVTYWPTSAADRADAYQAGVTYCQHVQSQTVDFADARFYENAELRAQNDAGYAAAGCTR